ncbi:MAG: hypothetical protein CMD31_09820 [Flavobacteriales bacterium]|jgi:hypothetical protein|nr:hypothetical protein [Flavobacteriales bacterium]MBQ21040.1 hypothetical protein [Flavobacteriales bacterium]|tara:strand:+ start:8095 stop:8646 length:552 start_codon:yes stop_codon:yes gene_type:complete
MKKLILVSILVSVQLFVVAGNNNKSKSAKNNKQIKAKKEHKLNYDEFVNQYGANDTSLAVIEIFFDKRENSAKGQMSFLPLSTAVAVIIPPIGIGLMAASTPLFINGLIVNQKYNRRKLKNILDEYQSTNELPIKLQNKVNDFIEDEQEYERYYEDKLVEYQRVRVQANPTTTGNDVVVQTNN